MVARAFRKTDHAGILVAQPEAGDNCLDRHQTPTLKLGEGKDASPGIEDLHGLDTSFDLPAKIVDRHLDQPVNETLKQIALAVGKETGRHLIGRAFAGNHIASKRPWRAAKANQRGFGRKGGFDALDRLENRTKPRMI